MFYMIISHIKHSDKWRDKMLAQTKLTKKEWEMVEVKVTPDKMEILDMMNKGYDDIHVVIYKCQYLYLSL